MLVWLAAPVCPNALLRPSLKVPSMLSIPTPALNAALAQQFVLTMQFCHRHNNSEKKNQRIEAPARNSTGASFFAIFAYFCTFAQ